MTKRTPNVGPCSVEGCEQPMRKRQWCASHYAQWRRIGEVKPFAYKWSEGEAACRVCGEQCSGRRNYCSTNCQARHAQSKGERPKTFTCQMCLREMPASRIGGRLTRTDTKWCSDCGRESPEVQRFRRYGIRPAEYEAATAKGCGICGATDRKLHIDHDHTCCPSHGGHGPATCHRCVRGLICGPCNRGLGLFADSADALRRAAEYLDAAHQRTRGPSPLP